VQDREPVKKRSSFGQLSGEQPLEFSFSVVFGVPRCFLVYSSALARLRAVSRSTRLLKNGPILDRFWTGFLGVVTVIAKTTRSAATAFD
jgi:hypothetical protein